MRLRVRAPNGVHTLALPDTASVADLKSQITDVTQLPGFDLKSGYPPQSLNLDQFDDELKLSDTGLKLNGEQLIATARDIADALKHPLTHATSPPPATPAAPPPAYSKTPTQPTTSTSIPPSKPSSSQTKFATKTSAPQRPAPPNSDDPPEIPLPFLSGTLVLRVMPDDNSCLFRAFGSAVLGPALDSMHELRAMIAGTIQSQPEVYSRAVLEKDPSAYCAWIQREDAWGGAIEIGILSQQFEVEVCSVNVQDLRVDRFNEGAKRRVILVYSGIHYDVIAVSPSEPPHAQTDLPAEFDVKVFEGEGAEAVLAGALQLCRELQAKHYYTDTAGFSVHCNTCGWGGKGERAATEHAKSTGHYDFGEA